MENVFEDLVDESFLAEQASKDPKNLSSTPVPEPESAPKPEKKAQKSKQQRKEAKKIEAEEAQKKWEELRRKELEELKEGKGVFAYVREIKYPAALNAFQIKFGVMYDHKEREGTKRRHQVDTVVEGMSAFLVLPREVNIHIGCSL